MVTDTELPSINPLSVRLAARSHPGSLPQNEDACAVAKLGHASVVVLADGAGGHTGGEVASEIVARTIKQHFEKLGSRLDPSAESVAASLRGAQAALRSAIVARPRLHDMRSTGLVVLATSKSAWIGHVGDTRAYLARDGEIKLLTRDDTLVQALIEMGQLTPEKARNHSKSNVLLQSLGQPREDLEFHVSERLEMRAGDVIIACSDGLTDVLTDEQILREVHGPSRAVAERLLDLAVKGGAPDNVTVAVLSWRKRPARPSIAAQSTRGAKGKGRPRSRDSFALVARVLIALAAVALVAALVARRGGGGSFGGGRVVFHLPQ